MRLQNQQNNAQADEAFMRLAIEEAKKGAGRTSPNPAVGAVIVKEGRVLAKGYHRAAGRPHAEVEALRKTTQARGATLYVTLEPCSTHGRTPPCTEAILAAEIARVVVGAVDPNPKHAGRGLKRLQAQGVAVAQGVLEASCRELNLAFNKWIVTGLPWVIAKAALTLDGRLTLPPGAGRWLSGPAARKDAHALRARVDAILVGAGTLRADNPRLTVRGMPGEMRQPWRVVLAGGGELPKTAHLFADPGRTLVFQGETLPEVLAELGRRDITSVLVEGGGTVLGSVFDARMVDEVQFYLTPLLVAGPVGAVGGKGLQQTLLHGVRYARVGRDVLLCARTAGT